MHGRRLLASLLVIAALGSTAGCWRPGGRGMSVDAYTYISTAFEPKTVSVIDTRTGQTIWSYDVPVGRQLDIEFFENDEHKDANLPDIIKWRETYAGNTLGTLSGQSVAMPPASARRIDLKLRPAPEYPAPKPVGPGTGGHG